MRKWTLILLFLMTAAMGGYSYVQYRAGKQKIVEASRPQVQPRNIYLITASGLRPDHLSSYLYQHIQTPAIDFLAYDGVRFTNAFTTATDSLSAHLSLLTGTYPFRQPLKQTVQHLWELSRSKLPKEISALPLWFGRRGYRTAAFLADPELRYPSFFLNLFQDVFTGDERLPAWKEAYSPSAICDLARHWILQNRTKPQLVLLNFNEPAAPFRPPPPYDRQYANHLYDGEIAALDEQIGLFMNMLKDNGLFQKSIIVFTSPFGASLEGTSRYASPQEAVIRVPLLITAPGLLPRHQEYNAETSLVDVSPTVTTLLEQSSSGAEGLPLFQKGSDVQVSHDFILGQNYFPRLLGFPSYYFVRSNSRLIVAGPENAEPQDADAGIQKALSVLKKEKLLSVNPVKIQLDTDPGILLETAIGLAQQNHPVWALDLLDSFHDQLPNTTYLQFLQGSLFYAAGDPDSALQSLQKAYALSENPGLLPPIASIYLDQKRYGEALQVLAQTAAPSQIPYYTNSMIGIAHFGLQQYDKALSVFRDVLEANPGFSEAYLYRGRIFEARGDFQKAEMDFRKAIDSNPYDAAAYREMAGLLLQQQQEKEAIPYLRKALTLNPEDFPMMLQLARAHQEFGNNVEARKLCHEIILRSDDPELIGQAKQIIAAN